jgi:hypothetical protein
MIDYRKKYSQEKPAMPHSPYKKDKEFFLGVMKHHFGVYSSNGGGIGFGGIHSYGGSSRRSFSELRDHARGLVDPSLYQNRYDPPLEDGPNKGTHTWDISWQPYPIIPKFRNILKDKFRNLVLQPSVEANDASARMERNFVKNRMKLERRPETQQMVKGTPYASELPSQPGIDTPDDVEFFYQMGGIMLGAEILMKDAIDAHMKNANWKAIEERVYEDIIDLNIMSIDTETVNGVVKYRYVDPAWIIIPPSTEPDYSDCDYRGYIELKKHGEIVLEASGELTEEEENQLAKIFESNSNGDSFSSYNRGIGKGSREDYAGLGSGHGTHSHGHPVMVMYFLDIEVQRYVEGRHPRGSRIFERVDEDFELSERGKEAGKSVSEYSLLKMYKAKWVVGTDIVYNCEEVQDIVKAGDDGQRSIMWPLTVISDDEPSFVEKIIAFDDDIQHANFKLRNLIGKIPPAPRMVIFQNLVRDSVDIGDETFTILDMAKMFQNDGIWVMDRKQFEDPGMDSNQPPVMFLESGIAEDVTILENRIMSGIDKIRNATGMNEVSDGSTPKSDMLVQVMQGFNQAANAALSGHLLVYILGFQYLCKQTGFGFINKILKIKQSYNSPLDVVSREYAVNHDFLIRVMQYGDDILRYEWNIEVKVETTERRNMIIQDLMSRKELLDEQSYFSIWDMILDGDYAKAKYFLAKYSAKAKAIAHQRQVEVAQSAARATAEANIQTEQAKIQTLQVEYGLKAELLTLEARLASQSSAEDHALEIEKIREDYNLSLQKELAVVKANNQNRLQNAS